MTNQEIRVLRKTLKETRRVFARRFGVSYRTVESWEQGAHVPHPTVRQALEALQGHADQQRREPIMTTTTTRTITDDQIRYGTFGPIVWNSDGSTRCATQHDMDTLPCGPDLTADEEAAISE